MLFFLVQVAVETAVELVQVAVDTAVVKMQGTDNVLKTANTDSAHVLSWPADTLACFSMTEDVCRAVALAVMMVVSSQVVPCHSLWMDYCCFCSCCS